MTRTSPNPDCQHHGRRNAGNVIRDERVGCKLRRHGIQVEIITSPPGTRPRRWMQAREHGGQAPPCHTSYSPVIQSGHPPENTAGKPRRATEGEHLGQASMSIR